MNEMCSVCIVRAQRDDDDFLPCSPACFRAALNAREQCARWDEREKAEIHDYHMPAWTAGFAAGLKENDTFGILKEHWLDAAREAVMAITFTRTKGDSTQWIIRDAAIAAINALQEKP